jgi:hypothetical protein
MLRQVVPLIGLVDGPVDHKLRMSLSSSVVLLTLCSLKKSLFVSFLRVSLRLLIMVFSSGSTSSHLGVSGFTLRFTGRERDVLLPMGICGPVE